MAGNDFIINERGLGGVAHGHSFLCRHLAMTFGFSSASREARFVLQ